MNREVRKKLEQAFYNYKKNRDYAVCAALNDIATRALTAKYNRLGIKNGSAFGGGFEDALVKSLDATSDAWKWCKVVEHTLNKYRGEYKDKLIEIRYFKQRGINETAVLLNIDRRTFFRWNNEIMATAQFWAEEYRLFPWMVQK